MVVVADSVFAVFAAMYEGVPAKGCSAYFGSGQKFSKGLAMGFR